MLKFHYASGVMGSFGEGWFWHQLYKFPTLSFTTKTITRYVKVGLPFAVLPIGNSVFNKVSLHNMGFVDWVLNYNSKCKSGCTISLHGNDHEIASMVDSIDYLPLDRVEAIELNFSCPNVKSKNNCNIPTSVKPIYLKLNYRQDPYKFDLDKVKGIRLNSLPLKYCGGSGKIAQRENWSFIERYSKEGLNISGCSFLSYDDISYLENLGCTEMSIGSVILTNPKFVENILRSCYEN